MRRENIQTKIDVILDNIEKLSSLKIKTYEDFVSDFRNVDSALFSKDLNGCKTGVIGFSKTMAEEMAHYGIMPHLVSGP